MNYIKRIIKEDFIFLLGLGFACFFLYDGHKQKVEVLTEMNKKITEVHNLVYTQYHTMMVDDGPWILTPNYKGKVR